MSRLRGLWPVRRLAAFAGGVWDTFLRDNKVIPPVLAVLALFIFAWIVGGSLIGGPDEPISNRADEVAQSEGGQPEEGQPPAPEIDNPNSDSYAAYQSKDPFRQLFQTAESTEATPDEDTTFDEDTTLDEDTSDDFSDDTTSDDPLDDPTDDGFQDDEGVSDGDLGAADDQYADQQPREDFTDTDDADTDDANDVQTPPQQTPPASPGGGLFDSGGDLDDPNGR